MRPAFALLALLLGVPLATEGFVAAPGPARRSGSPLAAAGARRGTTVLAREPPKPRDPEVERATGGGWRAVLPSREAVIGAAVIGCFTYLAADTPLGTALTSPLVRTVEKEQQVDDAGVPYGPSTEKILSTGSVGVLVAWQLIGQFVVRPRLVERAKAAAEAEREAEDEAEAEVELAAEGEEKREAELVGADDKGDKSA